MKKKWSWTLFYTLLITIFTAYTALDTFVFTDIYAVNAGEENLAMFEGLSADKEKSENAADEAAEKEAEKTAKKEADATETSGGAESAESTSESTQKSTRESGIKLTEYRVYDTNIYVADVYVNSAADIKTAFAYDTYGRNVTDETSAIAEAHGASLAINGDYYGSQERGIVIRNGVIYRDTAGKNELLIIYADGTMEIAEAGEYTAEELLEGGAWQVFSFGPGLLEEGSIAVTEGEEVGKAKASNPRTAIGIVDENHYVFVVSDGRTDESEGLSLYELAEFMQSLGVKTAYNLDGGGSSTMYYNGEIVNVTTSGRNDSERKVSDIVYIA